MYKERIEDLSVYYFLKTSFSDASYIHIEDGFPEKVLELPTVSVDAGRISVEQFELGNRDGIRVRTWYINIFANNKSQRDEFGYRLLGLLKDGINVYNYDLGFPPTVVPVIGHLNVLSKSYEPIRIVPSMVETMYYRAAITFVAQNDII